MNRYDNVVEVISISDTESSRSSPAVLHARAPSFHQQLQQDEPVTLTLSSTSQWSTERVPVTWSGSTKKPKRAILNAETFLSPSPLSKVKNWLNSVNVRNEHVLPESPAAQADAAFSSSSSNKSSILVRQDYKKSGEASANSHITMKSSPSSNAIINRIIYLDCSSSSKSVSANSVVQMPSEAGVENCQAVTVEQIIGVAAPVTPPLSTRKILLESMQGNGTPLSPDTQKKIELCDYLKLVNMNPSDLRTFRMRQSRRSSRVKHLAMMSEKRELERKLNSELQSDEKKKSCKGSDEDSGQILENGRSSKLSSKRSSITITSSSSTKTSVRSVQAARKSTDSSRTKTPEKHNEPKVQSNAQLEPEPPLLERRKTPSKFLQVPEVSTTSISKAGNSLKGGALQLAQPKRAASTDKKGKSPKKSQNNEQNNGSNKQESDDTLRREVVTRKSFVQLSIDIRNLKRSRMSCSSERSRAPAELNFSFADSAKNVPNIQCDFDESINLVVDVKTLSSKASSSQVKKKQDVKSPSKKLKRQASPRGKALEGASKPKVRKLNGALKKVVKSASSKIKPKSKKALKPGIKLIEGLEIHNNFARPKHINKLRSRGRLQQIGISKVLLKEKKKRSSKSKIKRKLLPKLKLTMEKNFRTTELIQHGQEDVQNAVLQNVQPTEVVCVSVESSPKSDSLQSRCPLPKVVWKNFTSEHRRAYMESIKFLRDDGNPTSPKISLSPTKSVITVEKVEEKQQTNSPVEQVSFSILPESHEKTEIFQVEKQDVARKSVVTPASDMTGSAGSQQHRTEEDLEVDRLMSGGKQIKHQAAQKNCESPTNELLSNYLRCTSSEFTSSSSSTLQTVPSNSEPTIIQEEVMVDVSHRYSNHTMELLISQDSKLDAPMTEPEQHFCQTEETFPFEEIQPEVIDVTNIEPTTCEYNHLVLNGSEIKSLYHCLTQSKKKLLGKKNSSGYQQQSWEEAFEAEESPRSERKAALQSHAIFLSNSNGSTINAYYLDYNLIVVQELTVSFWSQSPLGNILGAQDMWISRGNSRRMVLGNGCVHKESAETVISIDNSIAYIELWTKEHKSDKRERPVADVFVTVYLRLGRNGPDKKVLQLENIHAFATDVQYIVLRNSRCIIVSWTVNADSVSSSLVHCYHLSPDLQMVASISEMQTVGHYISSLHNVEDCDNLILGCGESKITIWNSEYGYVLATIDLSEIQPHPRAVWAKCDRGFLFMVHQTSDGVLQLVAINSLDSTWKRLQTYRPRFAHQNLLGICMESGLLVAFYNTGVMCWSAQTGEAVVEETTEDDCMFLPFGKHVTVVLNNQVHVRHALEYLVTTAEDS